ncbi:hypothetical protein PYL56_08845 [Staphylococcus succinus]|uniref:hypothetical protein n=1 Tax=Staphylococcus succinus TaxID=61015 RepID=UPI0024801B1D|nr:hypothetical protein [Staphylococcus succinus]MDH9161478.1 hypothetical protein [Staphylococcus succinus]
MTLKDIIQNYKKENGLKYIDLQHMTNVSRRTFEDYGCGTYKRMSYPTAKAINAGLGIEWEILEPFIY